MTTPAAAYPPNPVVDRASLPPGPPEWPVVGQSFRYMTDVLGLMRESAGYGDLVTMSTKPIVAYLINHPDLIEECFVTNHRSVGRGWTTEAWQDLLGMGLVTSDDPLHLRQRRLMQPQFNHRRIAGYAEVMTDFARRHETRWQDGVHVDMAREMGELTLHIVVRTLMGLDLPDAVRRIGAAFEIGNEYLTRRGNLPLRLRRLANRLPLPFTVRFKRGRAFLDETVYGLIAQRRESGLEGDDLLSLLLNVRDEEAANPEDAVMTDVQLRDEVITLFAAGHETTAVALTWTWYLLATHPDIQARFHAELDNVLGRRDPTFEDLSEPVLHGTDPDRVHAPVPAHLVHRPHGFPRLHPGGLGDSDRRRSVGAAADRSARPALVRGTAGVPPRPLDAGVSRGFAPVRLLPLRRRATPVHRRGFRLDGSHAGVGNDGSTLDHAPRPTARGRVEPAHFPAPERGDAPYSRAAQLSLRHAMGSAKSRPMNG